MRIASETVRTTVPTFAPTFNALNAPTFAL